MREFWLEPDPNLTGEMLERLVRDTRPDAVLLSETYARLGTRVAGRTPGADILVTSSLEKLREARNAQKPVALELSIKDSHDHEKALHALELSPDYLLVRCVDWRVIPLENLVAEARGRSKLIAATNSFEESRTALEALELGVDGIALSSSDRAEIDKTRELAKGGSSTVELKTAKITLIKPIGTGSRVCVDTVDLIDPNEGLLTGCSSQALFLVEAEVHHNPHVSPRPFRINAGPVSLYVLSPQNKTRYLSELSAGETVILADKDGRTRAVDVARVKIERRPMILIQATSENRTVKTILQNAETVRLITPNGSKSISDLKIGDEVLVHLEEGGRHFGTMVPEEMVVEK
jgi:3-dehydroquinate synthase II